MFSNLTNLEWQFVKLEENELKNNNVLEDSKKSNKNNKSLFSLLTPESFLRYDVEGNFLEFPYMPKVKNRDNVTEEDIQAGIDQMRRKAGVAMQYLDISARSHI